MIQAIGPEWAEYIALHQGHLYPPEMHEDVETFRELLASTTMSIGDVHEDALLSWAIFDGSQAPLYLYDLAVLPEYQMRGFAKNLMRQVLRITRWHGLDIQCHARSTSYPLLASIPFLTECGYRLYADTFLPNHYGKEYESETLVEDGHHLVLRPIGK